MPRVLIVQEHLPEFRVPFFEQLRDLLSSKHIDLQLVYAPNQRNTYLRGTLAWACPVPIHWIGPVGWQPIMTLARKSDLVIVQQELKYLAYPIIQILSKLGGPPLAYWGHGKNFQDRESKSFASDVKKYLSTQVHWWFAYNDLSASIVREMGYPKERITSVGNAIDTRKLVQRRESLTPDEIARARAELGLKSENVAIYTGGIYANKRINFLIEAALHIRSQVPDFELIVIGEGPDRHLVTAAAEQFSWIHDLGPKNDHDKVPYWAVSKLLLIPGLVGLVVVDSFALGVPLVTTDYPFHSPEIDYLNHGVNGIIVNCGDSTEQFATSVVNLLGDVSQITSLSTGALKSAGDYTIEKMAQSFAQGIQLALSAPTLK